MEILNSVREHIALAEKIEAELQQPLAASAGALIACLRTGGKVLLCGNGGSAADAQHFAAELVGRFEVERSGLPAIALTTDTSALTAIGNDYGFEQLFSRQVEALAQPKDLLVGISTSGNSANVYQAMETAKQIGCTTLALIGRDGGRMIAVADHALIVPAERTARIQEMHLLLIHLLCEVVDAAFRDDLESQ
ncbi:MAG: D-sedoheptulose 7-phosphate isomerase [Deltaproteobacteria bacterium]|nr:D-sedoheptulose 7-phosphate isomerase [Deltaproteobacteria bacterium]NCP03676.1 D-sedoheptulose 7-phosphate isomerase [Deltaproteobacteria bacterium]NCP77634.1 D-sedoheptulose 7-phosphate isomerase [Desulfuromonadales bacterium]